MRTPIVVALLVAAAVLPLFGPPRYLVTVVTEVFLYAIFAMSLDLLLGYTGMGSLGHAAFWGIGAYTAGILSLQWTQNALLTWPLAVLAAGLAALLIGAVCIRTSGVYLLMLTLAFTQMVYAAAFKWNGLTGGSNGLSGIPRPRLPLVDLSDGATFYYTALVAFVLSLGLLAVLVRSPLGQTFVGIRENEARMRALGYNTYLFKLASFVIGGLLAGLGGALNVGYTGFASPSDVAWTTSGQVMVMVIIGGVGTLFGPALGAALVLLMQNWVSSLPGIGERWQLVMGLVFVAFVLFARGGIVGIYDALAGRSRHERGGVQTSLPASRPAIEESGA
ncbi:MAG: branched-chain amino acid ABC transporter permease [Chloroflexi bacterium]|nr:branched-chain amino acid ABC transporter permease [Chloroflexota bacterium]